MKKLIIMLVMLSATLWAGEYEEAMKLIKAKKYSIAKIVLEVELKKTDTSKVRYALAFCIEKSGDKDGSVKHYKAAIIKNTDSVSSKKAETRLVALRPEIGPVLNAVRELEVESSKKRGGTKLYLKGASDALFKYAMTAKLKAAPKGVKVVGANKLKAPIGAKEYNGHKYKLFSGKTLTWQEASDVCNTMGGCLVSINDDSEQDFLNKEIFKQVKIAYIGIQVKYSRFRWVDGKPVKGGTWVDGPGKPVKGDYGIVHGGKWGSNLGEWRIVRGKHPINQYICEWEK